MKMKTSFYMLISALFVMVACTPKQETVRFTIASATVDCWGVGKQKCMLVKKGDAAEWEYFYSQIEGFTYEEGYEYVLEVSEEKMEDVPADASSIRYTLVKEVSKTAKESEGLPVVATVEEIQQAKYQWGGKVLEIENTTLGRGAAEGQFPAVVVKIEVTHSSTDLFKEGDVIHAELVSSPQVTPVVGREYVFKAKDAHPAHAKGIYMLDTNLNDLVK